MDGAGIEPREVVTPLRLVLKWQHLSKTSVGQLQVHFFLLHPVSTLMVAEKYKCHLLHPILTSFIKRWLFVSIPLKFF